MTARAHMLRNELARLLDCDPESLAMERPFHEIGVDSLVGIRLIGKLTDATGHELDPIALFDHPSICELANYLDAQLGPPAAALV